MHRSWRSSVGPAVLALSLLLAHTARAHALEFAENCDASAAVAIGPDLFLVGNDEDDLLRLYRVDGGKEPVWESKALPGFLAPNDGNEADIEGGAWLGDRIFWISSHGRDDEGVFQARRHQLFATEFKATEKGFEIRPVGRSYTDLVKSLLDAPQLQKDPDGHDLGLREAAGVGVTNDPHLAPKDRGLNIEGLAASSDGKNLLIGFRNPRPAAGALVVPVLNPNDVVNSLDGTVAPQFGAPVFLPLKAADGHPLGIRSMEYVSDGGGGAYYIVAGRQDEKAGSALYRWTGVAGQQPQLLRSFADLNPEALFAFPQSPERLVLLSDDGARKFDVAGPADCKKDKLDQDGKCKCKHLKPSSRRVFRVEIVQP